MTHDRLITGARVQTQLLLILGHLILAFDTNVGHDQAYVHDRGGMSIYRLNQVVVIVRSVEYVNHPISARRDQEGILCCCCVLQRCDLSLVSLDKVYLIELTITLRGGFKLIDADVSYHVTNSKLIPRKIEAQTLHSLFFRSKRCSFPNNAHISIEDLHLIVKKHNPLKVTPFNWLQQGSLRRIHRGRPKSNTIIFTASKEREGLFT